MASTTPGATPQRTASHESHTTEVATPESPYTSVTPSPGAKPEVDSESNKNAAASAAVAPQENATATEANGAGVKPDSKAPEEERSSLQTTIIILSLCSAVFLAALDVTIVTVAVPTIAEEFQSVAGYTWIGSAYLLANAASSPSWGKISDIFGRKPVLLSAVAVFFVGSLLAAVSVNMNMLIAARGIQGIGGGGALILVNITVSDLFSMRKRGLYFGIISMVWAVAGGMGPIVGGAFTSKVTWRWCFYINLPITALAWVGLFFNLKIHNPHTGWKEGIKAIDWLGTLTIVGGTIMLLLGLQFGGITFPWDSPTVICLIVFGFVLAGIFIIVEWKYPKYPIMPLHLFKHRSNVIALGVCCCHGFVFISASYYLPLYFQGVLGASPLLSGVYVLPFTFTLGVMSAVTGFFIKKTGKYLPMIILGTTLTLLGYGLFLDLDPTPNWAKIIIFQIILGIGVGPNFQSPLIALQTRLKPRDIASGTSTFMFLRQLFSSISIVAGGVVFQNGMQKQSATLTQQLGPQLAALFSGANAAASVSQSSTLPGNQASIVRNAYFNALQSMYILYVAIAGLGFVLSFFVGTRTLSQEHEEHKTGLKSLQKTDSTPVKDVEKGGK